MKTQCVVTIVGAVVLLVGSGGVGAAMPGLQARLVPVASASAHSPTGREITLDEVTPGFQNTVNNYTIPMDPTPPSCRPQNVGCSKHMNFHFSAHTNGRIDIPFEMTNDDALHGFCASVRIIARDRANPPGNILLDVQSGYYCIDAKAPGNERVGHVDWSFQDDPAVGIRGHDLFMQITRYDENIDWGKITDPIRVIAGVIKVLALPSK
jgi:hypothetical protein